METNININEEVKQSDRNSLKSHWAKHKMKYLVGGALILAGGIGYHFGNRGNSKHHYTKLLKDGVRDAVEEGMRDVVRDGMKDLVKVNMRDIVEDVVDGGVKHAVRHAVANGVRDVIEDSVKTSIDDSIRTTVGKAVKTAIKESALTVVKEVEPDVKREANMMKIIDKIIEDMEGVTIRTDENGTPYVAKQTV